ncbi:MAG: helix-turn-helix domain-containing protein [Propionibacteriaceae bacterium]
MQADLLPIGRWTDLGQAIKEARSAAGLTQQQLAQTAGVSRAWLARVEAGHRKAEIEYLMRTVEALGLTFALTSLSPDDTDPGLAEALRIAGLG